MANSKLSNDSKDNRQEGVEYKFNLDGEENPKYVDLLDEDKPIAGQKFCCVSFVSPEHIIKQREHFLMEEFIKGWDFTKSMEKFTQFLSFVSYKYNLNFENVTEDLQSFVKEEKETLTQNNLLDDYKNFLDRREDDLEKVFNELSNFKTCTRGLKVRGCFPTQQEAELRCKMLRELDPHHDVYVGPVGTWLPWEPEAYKTGRVEYMEEELNQLAQEKKKNETIAKSAFEQRVKETKQKAVEENKKNAEKHGNVVTQDIDSEGNLIGAGNNTTETTINSKDPETISVADIRSELFDGENIVVGKTDYGQSQLNSGPFSSKKEE